ncbi:Dna-mediated transposase [Oopsacas minuta]|uniref:Dna-mediated transposase n=1 Tax=Oopsacas minuta TaxID=111878 RepID=A0AAV7JBV9_9METZ|nr:Dna-mediated transposase [Oopsacas minuta]
MSTLPSPSNEDFPLRFQIADGLDGSGKHTVYNQPNTNTSTKSFILFCFKAIHIVNSSGKELWKNNYPNSPFSQRPIFLLAATENHDNIHQFMKDIINPETDQMKDQGFYFADDKHIFVDVVRSMLDGKMASILSGAGGASCQLCTATQKELKDRDLILQGYPINRNISDAIQLFGELEDIDAFFSLPTNQRFNLTHQPLSTIDILPASPLHSYTCIFRWFNLLVYHLNCNKLTWSPSSKEIKDSMVDVRTIVQEVPGLRIDQPDPKGGTTSTGGVARRAFSNDSKFIECAMSLVKIDHRDSLCKLHTQLFVILRIINSDRKINTEELGCLCTDTYLLILQSFPWVNITPTLHKLLAHSEEILREMNFEYGLKCFSEEGSEACNKLLRKYREHLARKTSFEDNVIDIFVRLSSESDPVLMKYRSTVVCANCGEHGHTRRAKCCRDNATDLLESSIDNIVKGLIIDTIL